MNLELPQKNILANYIGQIYVMAISVFIMPLYLQYMGAEAYGLVGFFVLMQFWLNLLDAGFAPTLGRQVAEARGNYEKFEAFFKLLRSIEIIFFILSVIIILVIFITSFWISTNWIHANDLGQEIIQHCIILMGIILSIRWFSTLYKSGINGFEDQVWYNKINIFLVTLKYLGSLVILIFISKSIKVFFYYQFSVGIVELLILNFRLYSLMPKKIVKNNLFNFRIDSSTLKIILPFSMSIAYTTLIWTLLMQFDRLLLSSRLSLDKFGYFSMILLVASSMVAIATPIFIAISPQMTLLLSQGDKVNMQTLYDKMTQLITWIVLSISFFVCIFSEPIIYIFIGNKNVAIWGKNILIFYSLGYALFVLGSFQYYLQNSFGNLRYYVRGASVMAIFQIPIMYFAIIKFGPIGSGITWFVFNLLWFFFFTWIVHRNLLPDYHFNWLFKKISPILLFILFLTLCLYEFFDFEIVVSTNRWMLLFKVLIIGICFVIFSSLSLEIVRNKLRSYIKVIL